VGPTDGRFLFFFDNVSKNGGDKDFDEEELNDKSYCMIEIGIEMTV